MRFPTSFLEEIRTRLPASRLIGQKVKLTKKGREWSGLSPFNREKTASFFVNDQKAKWFDFSAGKNGDIFSFVMETEGLQFTEAVERLAGMVGLPLPAQDPEAVKREARKLSLIEIVEEAASFFRDALKASRPALEYLAGRGIGPALIEEFGIGLALDDRSALKSHLAAEGIDHESAIEAGLIIAGDGIPVSYDRFRNRIMFPIREPAKGRTVGFSGRALGDAKAKYINSPECPIFDKGRLLFNADKAREPAWNEAPTIVVEGCPDAIQSSAAGYPATVAPMGTSLTDDQLLLLWRMSDEPIFCFDGDAAGQRAARRALDMALPHLSPARTMRFAFMPPGQDPDDVIRKRGKDAFGALIRKASSAVDMLWRVFADRPATTPEERTAVERDLMAAVDRIPDSDLRKSYRDDLKDRIGALRSRPGVYRSNGHSLHSASPGSFRLVHGVGNAPMALKDAVIVAAVLAAPACAVASAEQLARRKLTPQGRPIVECLMSILAGMPDADSDTLLAEATKAGIGPAIAEAVSLCQHANIGAIGPKAKAILGEQP